MDIGEVWAYRERAGLEGAPVRPVEILHLDPKRRGKVRIRYLDGDERGLDDWVARVRLKIPWVEADAWRHDERRRVAARDASRDALGTVEYEAVDAIINSYAACSGVELGSGSSERALLLLDDLAGVAVTLGLDGDPLLGESLAFVDRHGRYIAPGRSRCAWRADWPRCTPTRSWPRSPRRRPACGRTQSAVIPMTSFPQLARGLSAQAAASARPRPRLVRPAGGRTLRRGDGPAR